MRIIQRLRMPGLLSFPPDMDFFELQSLNVLIGPNASGKSNFIEVLGLLNALPTDFAAAIRVGGGSGRVGVEGECSVVASDDRGGIQFTLLSPAEVSSVVFSYGSPRRHPR